MVVGNLPYNVATAILERLLDRAPPGLELAFLVQREVAERIVATPGGKVYGSLSVLVQARGGPRILGRVRPGAFWPPPKVESAFFALRLEAWSHETVPWPEFKDLVRDAFKHRRKMLAGGLRRTWGDAAPAILEAAGIDRSARAESLGVADFRRLASARAALASAASGDANPR
jgi:16S rRNA (adenine1518-N6/adenine1519-N6)-dimethyltransferase